jgi:hypothetical protein
LQRTILFPSLNNFKCFVIQAEITFKFCTECGTKLTVNNKDLSQAECYKKLTITNNDSLEDSSQVHVSLSNSKDLSEKRICKWNDLETPLLSSVDNDVEKQCSFKKVEKGHLISDIIFSITRIRIRDM